ncbi:MAG TPA: type 2 lanthipeptide synthetase LanM [Streptosporangiaceae bacterium]
MNATPNATPRSDHKAGIAGTTAPSLTGAGTLLGLPGTDERLLAVLAAAAPFPERVSGEYFVTLRDRGRRLISQRSARWLACAVGDDETATRALFQHRQRSGRDLGAGLVDVAVRDPGQLPGWATALIEFLLAQPVTAAQDPAAGMVGAPFMSFSRAAERLLDWQDGRMGWQAQEARSADGSPQIALRGVPVTSEARQDVIAQFVGRLSQACAASFSFETRIFAPAADEHAWLYSTQLEVTRGGWLDRLESLPGLAYVIGIICLQWQRSVHELFDRLYADLPLLRRTLWGWDDPGSLDGFSGDSGDLHDHGRVVVLLTFSGGQRLVYKPKDLRSAAGFIDVVEYLNNHGLELRLPTRIIITRDDYGWEEFVEAGPTADADGASRYYQRFGQLVRLAEFLECRDFWADNLLAIGDGPAFIDLENLLQARIRKPVMLGQRLRALWSKVEDTAVKTACVSYPRLIGAGVRAQDIGCLADLQAQIAERPDSFPLDWEVPPYRPTCAGQLADPREYAAEVIAGYLAMQQCLTDNQAQLANPRGPLELLRGATVRYIWRNTFDSMEMLRACVSPLALVDGVARETVLAQVMRSTRELLHEDSARADVLEIVEEEIDAFRRMDVPLFQSRTDSDAVFTPDGTKIDSHFDGTAWDRLQQRIAELPRFPIDDHVAILRSCLDIARQGTVLHQTDPDDPDGSVLPQPSRGTYVYHPASLSPEIPADALIKLSSGIADQILAAAHPVDEPRGDPEDPARPPPGPAERLGWLGLVSYPVHGTEQFEPLHGDVLSGTAGLAIFFAEMYQSTGKPAYWNALHEALDGATDFAVRSRQSGIYRRMNGQFSPVGAFVGIGSTIYALSRCGQLIAEPQLVRAAAELLPLAAESVAGQTTTADIVIGRAGLLLALHRLREAAAEPIAAADELARELHAGLLAELFDRPTAQSLLVDPYPPGLTMLDGVPTGIDGVAFALARSAAALGTADQDATKLAAHAFSLENAGSVAAALASAYHLGTPVAAEVTDRVLARCANTWEHSCEGLVIDADLALWAQMFGGGDEFRLRAMRLLRALIARRERTGHWFGDRHAADQHRLSVLNGLAAIGMLALRLTDEDATSPRLAL